MDRLTREKYKLNLEILKPNQATFGTRSLKIYGPQIRNVLPFHIKSSKNLNTEAEVFLVRYLSVF